MTSLVLEYIQMLDSIFIIVMQIVFNFSRTLGTRHLARDNILPTLIWGTIIQISWLITTYMGVMAVANMDWLILSGYLIGGLLGSYLAMIYTIKEKK